MEPPNTAPEKAMFLTNVRYFPDKRNVLVTFQNSPGHTETRKYAFYPKLQISTRGLSKELLDTSISNLKPKAKIANLDGERAVLSFSSFEGAREAHSFLLEDFSIPSLLIEPERQFLAENGWSYFKLFSMGETPLEQHFTGLPDVKPDFLVEGLISTLTELLNENHFSAKTLTEKIALSSMLLCKAENIPEEKFRRTEIFLENLFFANFFPPAHNPHPLKDRHINTLIHGNFNNIAEINFSEVWLALGSERNMGPDTLNCGCCAPKTPLAENVSPSSLVSVEFLQDGIYFESLLPAWAEEMDSKMPGKKSRLSHQKEWYLPALPAGPFSRNSGLKIPLADAVRLSAEGKAKISENGHELTWFCKNNTSFLSREFSGMKSFLRSLENSITAHQKSGVREAGLAAGSLFEKDPGYFYRKAYAGTFAGILESLPSHLADRRSSFYDPKLGNSILALQGEVLGMFRQFAESFGARYLHSNNLRTFVITPSALELVKGFSARYNLPQPAVEASWDSLVFS